jgi:hypothetical protein
MDKLAACSEERFWTEVLIVALKRFDVANAFLKADAALDLHRHMWSEQQEGFCISMAANEAGHEVHWDAKNLETTARQRYRTLSAIEVWSAAFSLAWASREPLVDAATLADAALQRYAEKIGVVVSSLLADWNAESRRTWRRSWTLREQEA